MKSTLYGLRGKDTILEMKLSFFNLIIFRSLGVVVMSFAIALTFRSYCNVIFARFGTNGKPEKFPTVREASRVEENATRERSLNHFRCTLCSEYVP